MLSLELHTPSPARVLRFFLSPLSAQVIELALSRYEMWLKSEGDAFQRTLYEKIVAELMTLGGCSLLPRICLLCLFAVSMSAALVFCTSKRTAGEVRREHGWGKVDARRAACRKVEIAVHQSFSRALANPREGPFYRAAAINRGYTHITGTRSLRQQMCHKRQTKEEQKTGATCPPFSRMWAPVTAAAAAACLRPSSKSVSSP